MWRTARRLALGFALIILASSVLLLSDLDHRKARAELVSRHSGGGARRQWKLYLVQYNDVLDVKESEEGVREGLRQSGLQEGRDFSARVLNAQGDMATVSSLIDAAVNGGADMLITFSTPTLQAAIQRAPSLPIVYTYVANGLIAGAGRSETDHLPNLTGVNLSPPSAEMVTLIRTWFPKVLRVGTLFVPSEVNMVYMLGDFRKVAEEHGLEVVSLPVSTATEVPDAAAALTGRRVDAICQIPGNLTASAFASIQQAAIRARLPVFAFQRQQAADGALIVMARDYRDAGRQSGTMAARIMRGEDPARIPLAWSAENSLLVNLNAARELRLQLPAGLLQSAKQVLGRADGSPETATR